jgi:ubiquitin
MQLVIKTVKGETFNIEVDPSYTILQVKQEIQKKFGAEAESQKLISKGKHLEDNKTLGELQVQDKDCFIMMLTKVRSSEDSAPEAGCLAAALVAGLGALSERSAQCYLTRAADPITRLIKASSINEYLTG